MRIVDGPDEVHLRSITRAELPEITHRSPQRSPQMSAGVRELSGAWNFRDIARTARVRSGRLFRSSERSRLEDGRTGMPNTMQQTLSAAITFGPYLGGRGQRGVTIVDRNAALSVVRA